MKPVPAKTEASLITPSPISARTEDPAGKSAPTDPAVVEIVRPDDMRLPPRIEPLTPSALTDHTQQNLDKQLRDLVKFRNAISSLTNSTRKRHKELEQYFEEAAGLRERSRKAEEEVAALETECARSKEELRQIQDKIKMVEKQKEEKLTELETENARITNF